jgi:hypothetical protein
MRNILEKVRQISTKAKIEITSLFLYFILQFPGRIGADANTAMGLMREGKSTSYWTELYFWFLKILTFDGTHISLVSFVGLACFIFALSFLTNQLWSISKVKSPIVYYILILSPIVGVYAMTVDHNLQATTGNLLAVGLLVKLVNEKSYSRADYVIFAIAVFLSAMSFIGLVGLAGFLVSLLLLKFPIKKLVVLGLAVIFFVSSSTFLPATPRSVGFKYTPFLMDIRCLVPNKNVEISMNDLEFLSTLGPLEIWKEPVSCIVADSTEFARPSVTPQNELELMKVWFRLARDNPRYILLAHVQRASVALPPGITASQPNAYETNLLLPFGTDTPRELRTWNGVVDDNRYQTEEIQKQPVILSYLHYAIILPTILLNNYSWFWGWGGLWLLVGTIVSLRRWGISGITFLLPIYSCHLLLFAMSPTPNPRYTFLATITGLTLLSVTKIRIGDQLK